MRRHLHRPTRPRRPAEVRRREPLDPLALRAATSGRRDVLTPSTVLAVQRSAGNAAAAGLLAVQRAGGCAYGPGEVARSRTAAGLLPRDVSLPIGHPDATADFDPVVVADFAVNDASVKASTAAELRSGAWISIIDRQAAKKLEFVGFTDCAGAEARNASLRQQRAEAVAALFPAARGQATSVGPAPAGAQITDGAGARGRAGNRAVLIRAPHTSAPATTQPAANTPVPARPKPRYGRLRIEDATRSQVELIRLSARRAVELVDHAVHRVVAPVAQDALPALEVNFHNVHRYFEPPRLSYMREIRAGLATIATAFAGTVPIEVEHDEDGTTKAYVYRVWTDIHLNPEWFRIVDNDQRAKTLIHESAHKYLDINRDTYRWDTAAYAALTTPQALENADCFAWLCLDLR